MKIEQIKPMMIPILKSHGVTRAGVFGSYVKTKQTEASDIDVLIELEKKISLLEFVKIKHDLEDKLHKKVDLVEYQAIKPTLKEKILTEEVRIYG